MVAVAVVVVVVVAGAAVVVDVVAGAVVDVVVAPLDGVDETAKMRAEGPQEFQPGQPWVQGRDKTQPVVADWAGVETAAVVAAASYQGEEPLQTH